MLLAHNVRHMKLVDGEIGPRQIWHHFLVTSRELMLLSIPGLIA